MASGLPRSGVAVKLQPQALQRWRWWPRTVPFLTNAAPAHLLQLTSTNPALPIPRWNPHIRPSIYGKMSPLVELGLRFGAETQERNAAIFRRLRREAADIQFREVLEAIERL